MVTCVRCVRLEADRKYAGNLVCELCEWDLKAVVEAEIKKGRPIAQPRSRCNGRWEQVVSLCKAFGTCKIQQLQKYAGLTNVQAKDYLHANRRNGRLEQVGPGEFKLVEAAASAVPPEACAQH